MTAISRVFALTALLCLPAQSGGAAPDIFASSGPPPKLSTLARAKQPRTLTPGAKFASRATELVGSGWRLAAVDVKERGHHRLVLSLVFALNAEARSLSLSFDRGDETVRSYKERPSHAPKDRVYRNEDQLLSALARGPVRSLSYECASYFLAVDRGIGTETGAEVDPLDYFVFRRKTLGKQAAADLVREFQAQSHGTLVDVRTSELRDGEHGAAEFVWSNKARQYEAIIRTGIDAKGRVLSVEILSGPYRDVRQRLSVQAQASLMASFASQQPITALTAPVLAERRSDEWHDEILPFTLHFGDGSEFVIQAQDFGSGDIECGC